MITELRIPYPDFKMGDLIDPEQHDMNNLYIQNKVNNLVDFVNALTGDIPGDQTGAELISIKPVPPFTETKLQAFLDALLVRLTSITAPNSGASLIGTAPGTILTGATVAQKFSQLEAWLGTQFVVTEIIRDGAVTNPKLASNAVSESKIANFAVTDSKLANNSVINSKYAPKSLTGDKVADRTLTSLQIQIRGLATENYADLSVTDAKIASRAITSSKIGTQQVKEEHLDPKLLEYLPNTQLTAKVLNLEARADQNDLKNHTQDLNITDNKTAIDGIITRLNGPMPLRFTKDGKTYSWGMRVVDPDGQVQLIYEELI